MSCRLRLNVFNFWIFKRRQDRFIKSNCITAYPLVAWEHLLTVSLGCIYLIMWLYYFSRLLLYWKWVSAHCGWVKSVQESQITSKLGVEGTMFEESQAICLCLLGPSSVDVSCKISLCLNRGGLTGRCYKASRHERNCSACNGTK